MRKHRVLALIVLVVVLSAVWVQASGSSKFLNNGFQALYYHAVRLEESFPRLNPVGMAIEEFEKAAREGLSAGEANLMMGLVYQYLDRPGTALGYYLEFTKLQPAEIWIHSFIGDLYAAMGRMDEAVKSYELVVSRVNEDETFAGAYYGLGTTAFERGEYAKAKEAFELALKGAGDFVDARLSLGKTLYYLSEYEEAIATLERAQLQAPRSVAMFYYLGLSYEASGRTEQAEHAFLRVEELRNEK